MNFRATQIHDALKAHSGSSTAVEEGPPSCDVTYALFLEPRPESDPRWTTAECVVDKAVRTFQPHPALAHCELLMPPVPTDEGMRTNFATYFGRHSAWQTDKVDGFSYYLIENAERWRAVPIFSVNAAAKLRGECDSELGVPYSLMRYLSAVPPFRSLAGWLSDKRRAPAHCATLTARVLKNSTVYMPVHASAWYGPSTLYKELADQATWKGERLGAGSWEGMPLQTAQNVEQLLRGVMSPQTVQDVGDMGCLDAVRGLTMRACNALINSDETAQRLTQQQLATALLRWVVLRGLTPPTSDADVQPSDANMHVEQ